MTKSKDGVEIRAHRGAPVPAINVKVHVFPPLRGAAYDDFEALDRTRQADLEMGAFRTAQEVFWEEAQTIAEDVLSPNARVESDGRSGGWLIVPTASDPEDWTEDEVEVWEAFAHSIKKEIAAAKEIYLLELTLRLSDLTGKEYSM